VVGFAPPVVVLTLVPRIANGEHGVVVVLAGWVQTATFWLASGVPRDPISCDWKRTLTSCAQALGTHRSRLLSMRSLLILGLLLAALVETVESRNNLFANRFAGMPLGAHGFNRVRLGQA